jgi:putative transposase
LFPPDPRLRLGSNVIGTCGRGLPRDHGERSVIAGNVLDRQFTADRPNQKWVADFTYVWTAEGWLYAAA